MVSFSLWFLLVTVNRQNSYESGIPRQDYGIIRSFIGHHQSANLVWNWYPSQDYGLIRGLSMNRTRLADLPIRTETGGFNNRTWLCCPCIAAILNPTFLTPCSSNPSWTINITRFNISEKTKKKRKIFSERQCLNSCVCIPRSKWNVWAELFLYMPPDYSIVRKGE